MQRKRGIFVIYRMGELFCGPGGLAWGAINANIDDENTKIIHAWANDIDDCTCQTYRHNICKNDRAASVICEDVRELEISKENLSDIDAFSFGFPCNDFSIVGEQKGFNGDFGALYTYGVTVLKIFQPQWFLAENVSGLSSANKGAAFKKILDDLRAVGYKVFPHLYKFEEYGVPQSRHRIIIVGIRENLPYDFKPPSTDPYKEVDVSVRTALSDPPIDKMAFNHEAPFMSEKVIERLKYIKPGQNAFNADMPEEIRLKVKGAKISQIYKRLDPTKPAYTVTGSGGGGTHMYHYEENRALTNRERARLQTFPDNYEFFGSREKVRRQIGMAVPCRGAKIIFEAILRTMNGIDYESVPCNIKT